MEYKQAKFNQVADGLSRKGEEAMICLLTLPQPSWWDSITELHEMDVVIKGLKERVENGELGEQWVVKRGVLFLKDRVYLPEDYNYILMLLQQFHNCGHEGFYKMLLRINECFYWKNLKLRVKEWVRQCDVCQSNKYDQQLLGGLLQPLPIPKQI